MSNGEKRSRDSTPGAMKPVALTPTTLRTEPARLVSPSEVVARKIESTAQRSEISKAKSVLERAVPFTPMKEAHHALRKEAAVGYELNPIRITPADMRELRARRIAAKDLGWVIPGHRIRIQQ